MDLGSSTKLPQTVVGFLVKNNLVTLGLRKKVSLGLGEHLISGIGGKVGDAPEIATETQEQALVREMQEEIGINIIKYRRVAELTFIFPEKPQWDQTTTAFIVDDWFGEPLETESIKPLTYNQHNLPIKKMWDDNRFWLPQILAGHQVIATFVYNQDNSLVAKKEIKIL